MNHQRAENRRPQSARSSSDAVVVCWVSGLLLLLVGDVLAVLTVPGTETNAFGDTVGTGSTFGFLLGVLLAGIGQVVLLVAVIATGVRLGMAGRS